MSRDTNILQFRQPDTIDDPLNELARQGARRTLAQALITEADAFVAQLKDLKWRTRVTELYVTVNQRQDHAVRLQDRGAIRQGPARLNDGRRHPHRSCAR
jgi:hypothetical protein